MAASSWVFGAIAVAIRSRPSKRAATRIAGIALSGGQKQRAAIARALIKDPAILILDDPLSAVDARTEEEILAGLASYYGDRTVLIVSHRLSALRGCDRIIVLDGGSIAEQGSHNELLALNGHYAAIHREQQLREEIESF